MRRRIEASDVVGQVVGGGFGRIVVRQKAGFDLEIGDILVLEEGGEEAGRLLILSVFDLEYASQIDSKTHEMMSGVSLEEEPIDATLYEPDIVNYVIASIKPLVRVAATAAAQDAKFMVTTPKALPPFSSTLRPVSGGDLRFLEKNRGGLFVGNIRSGSEVIKDAEVWLPIKDVFTHHVLIPATTGRGKSNLVKTMLWNVIDSETRVGILVLDAHDEYYGKTGRGLKDHPRAAERLAYYTTERGTVPGARTLVINLRSIEPRHFEGIVEFSDAQLGAIHRAYAKHGKNWIAHLMGAESDHDGGGNDAEEGDKGKTYPQQTIAVIRRNLRRILDIDVVDDGHRRRLLHSRNGIFDTGSKGEATARDMVAHIESGSIVILDASQLNSEAELVVGNVVATRLLERYKRYKTTGELGGKPVASIIIEEAPRVIGEDVLESKNDNIYSTIAREGRKFKVGLVAVTQLASVIPRTILANMTTKIILGNEMKQEREALIASASQDLSSDDKNIASLDKGEAIITSIFVPFAIPIKIPNFDDLVARKAGAATARLPQGRVRVFG